MYDVYRSNTYIGGSTYGVNGLRPVIVLPYDIGFVNENGIWKISSDTQGEIPTPTLTLDKTTITKEITNGSTATVTLTATLTNATGTLTWKSSNTTVATVSGSGSTATVTLKAAGTATITVSYGSYSATCTVTVTEKAISLTLDKTTITKEIESGSTATETLTATLTNATGDLNWTSSNTSVAEVVGNGNTATVTLKAAGTATITVSYGSYSATCICTVNVVDQGGGDQGGGEGIVTNKLNGTTITINSTNSSYTHTYEFGDKTLESTEFSVLSGDFEVTPVGKVAIINADMSSISMSDNILSISQAPFNPLLPEGTVTEGMIQITFTFSDGTTDTDTFKIHHTI